MPPRPGRAIAASLAAALLAGTAYGAVPGPGPAKVPLIPAESTQHLAPSLTPDETAPEPVFPEIPNPEDIASGKPVRVERNPAEQTWLDQGHTLVGNLLGTVLKIDRFFSDERDLDAERDRSFLRWRNDFRVGTDDRTVTYRTTLLADLKFPGLNRWLEHARLVIAGQNEDAEVPVRDGPGGVGGPSPASPTRSVGRAAAELQYALFETFRVKTDVGAGILFELPPGGVARLRLRYAEPVGELLLLRLAAVTFVRTDLGVGELLQAEVEHRFASDSLVRLGGGATANHRDRDLGVQWGSELALIRAIGPRSAISLGVGLDGLTRPAVRVNTYRTYARLRHDVFRRWIFVELEPGVAWPFDPLEPRTEVYSVNVRLEAQFQGDGHRDRERVRAPPRGPIEPEPSDPP